VAAAASTRVADARGARRRSLATAFLTLALAGGVTPAAAGAQATPAPEAPADAFGDAPTRALHASARGALFRVETDLLAYTALVRQRGGVELRLPLRDRTLYRMERASRVFWSRDGDVVVQVLGGREVEPGDREVEADRSSGRELFFNPGAPSDRLTFGLVDDSDDDVWFHHPLGRNAEQHYRFASGETLTLSLPDGRQLRAVELQVIPREADFFRITGSLWIEPESGSLVRAVYRMSEPAEPRVEDDGDDVWIPGIFRPMTAEFTLATVDYALWDFRVWLPRSMRIEGIATAGIVKVPAAIEVSYRMESVTLQGDLAEAAAGGGVPAAGAAGSGAAPPVPDVLEERSFRTRSEAMAYLAQLMAEQEGTEFRGSGQGDRRRMNGRMTRVFRPTDEEALLRSPDLPPPIWEDAPGFVSRDQIDEMLGILDGLPGPATQGVGWAFNWGSQRPDLLRYNRVEALAIGARGELFVPSPLGPLFVRAQPFFGVADLALKAKLTVDHETLRRKLSVGVYRELEPVDRLGRHLGVGNSASAFFFGRDEGEYFMATGGEIRITPPSAERTSLELRLYGELHSAVETNTSFSLNNAFDGDWRFQPNVEAEEVTEYGASLLVSPWWGTDPLAPQVGVELFAHGATGDRDFARASAALRGSVPLFRGVSVGAEVAAGESWGEPPLQRNWFLGGSHTLRGYPSSTLVGRSFARSRVELVRKFQAVGVSLFGDGAWAGERLGDLRSDDALFSVGAGFSLLDGILRLDLARALREPTGFRLHLYLDGIL
jgi:hypothetical protein